MAAYEVVGEQWRAASGRREPVVYARVVAQLRLGFVE